jgi:molybdate transport system substrate-binding protein
MMGGALIQLLSFMPFHAGIRMGTPRQLVVAIALVLGFPAASLSQVRVLMSGGFAAAYRELLPQFENTTGITVTTATGASQGDGPNTIRAQLRRGVAADMVIMSREGLAELQAENRIAIGSDVDLGQVPLGVGVRAGLSHPNIGTVDAFKQTLLRAKSIGIQSSSAIYLRAKVFPQLGIAGALEAKLSDGGAASVAAGETEMIILPVSEILPYPGVDFVGTIPAELQFVQVFAAAVIKGATGSETAKRLIAFLASDEATSVVEKTGMKRTQVR